VDVCFLSLAILSFVALLTCLIILPFVLPKYRMLNAAAYVDIDGLRPGYYAIRGTVLPMEVVRSPLTKKYCVYCNNEIQFYQGGKNAHWVTEKNVSFFRKFMLMDASGGVMINPSKAKVDIPSKIAASTFSQNFRALLAKHKVATTTWFGFTKRMRCLEKRIEPDMKLTIIGTVTKDITLPTPTGLVFNQAGEKFLITPKKYGDMKNKTDTGMKALKIIGGLSLFFLLVFTLAFVVTL